MNLEKKENKLLSLAIFFYISIFIYLKYKTNKNESVCSILKKTDKQVIIVLYLFFSYFILEYEKERKDIKSYYILLVLVISILFLILFLENDLYHSFCSKIVFISILMLMTWHFFKKRNNNLGLILLIEYILVLIIRIKLQGNILIYEILFLLLFAVYYFYLHYLDYYADKNQIRSIKVIE